MYSSETSSPRSVWVPFLDLPPPPPMEGVPRRPVSINIGHTRTIIRIFAHISPASGTLSSGALSSAKHPTVVGRYRSQYLTRVSQESPRSLWGAPLVLLAMHASTQQLGHREQAPWGGNRKNTDLSQSIANGRLTCECYRGGVCLNLETEKVERSDSGDHFLRVPVFLRSWPKQGNASLPNRARRFVCRQGHSRLRSRARIDPSQPRIDCPFARNQIGPNV